MSRQLHLVNVFSTFGAGGMELACIALAGQLGERGITSSMVILKGGLNGVEIPASIKVFYLCSKDNSPALPLRLGKLLKWLGADVIHARNWGAWPDSVFGGKLSGAKTVFSFHGWPDNNEPPLRRVIAMKAMSGMTNRIFTVSQTSKGLFAAKTHINPEKILVIPNGVDTARFKPDNFPKPDSARFIIGAAGNLKPVKNHAELIKACGILKSQGMNIELRIAGRGPLKEKLLTQAEDCGLNGSFSLPGSVTDMPGFYNSLDCFVLPSLSEAHPNTLLEAMACGLPCVATDTGGVRDILDDGRCGILATEPTDRNLADHITTLIDNPANLKTLGQNARLQVCDNFTIQKTARAYERLYRGLF